MTVGGFRNRPITSVQVTGRFFPARRIERHSLPTPGIDFQSQSGKRFHLRIGRYSLFLPVATKLAANHVVHLERWNRFQNLHFLIPNRLTVNANRRLHSQIGQNLEKMVLDHVADGAGLIVKSASSLDTEVFRHRDLDAFDVVSVPERLHERVRKPEKKHVIYRLLAKVMINAEDRGFIEGAEQNFI